MAHGWCAAEMVIASHQRRVRLSCERQISGAELVREARGYKQSQQQDQLAHSLLFNVPKTSEYTTLIECTRSGRPQTHGQSAV